MGYIPGIYLVLIGYMPGIYQVHSWFLQSILFMEITGFISGTYMEYVLLYVHNTYSVGSRYLQGTYLVHIHLVCTDLHHAPFH